MAEHDDTTTTEEPTESTEVTTPEHVPGPETPQESREPAPEAPEEGGQAEDLDVDALRAELKAARSEAAKYRVKTRELNDSLGKAKTPEEFEAVQARALELETSLHRERLARKYNLPEALAARITGDDDDARDADAKALAEAFHARSGGIGKGGLDPSTKTTPTDPRELARSVPRGRRQ
ncbi:hypothetical protein E0L36_26595 [Streptomyces sp. AJS327]|uniref:hypothetical protein n=1 Tax=Streptomyces sp. AJS327 TaxID=2545265 RepID=UPI0015E038BB|nr:hypothetical protein [Streptomyces sp. AJS327]MBA0054290.1 hypothetical protein [Streptomyces sp. AJS327]